MELSAKWITYCGLLSGLLWGGLGSEALARTWNDDRGGMLFEADYLGYAHGDVKLRMANGDVRSQPPEDLSGADLLWIMIQEGIDPRKNKTEREAHEDGETSVGDPDADLLVYPHKVYPGDSVLLIANNPEKIARGINYKVSRDGDARPGDGDARGGPGDERSQPSGEENMPFRRRRSAHDKATTGNNPNKYARVAFYRDRDGDGELNTSEDELLATDEDGSDGHFAEVSTASFPTGKQIYFALPMKRKFARKSRGKRADPEGDEKPIPKGSAKSGPIPGGRSLVGAGHIYGTDEDPSDNSAPSPNKFRRRTRRRNPKGKGQEKDIGPNVAEPNKDSDEETADEPGGVKKPRANGTAGSRAGVGGSGWGGYSGGNGNKADGAAGNDDEARGAIEGALGHLNDEWNRRAGPRMDAVNPIERALKYVGGGHYDSAIDLYNQLLLDEPNHRIGLQGRAACRLADGSYDLAVRDYDRVIELNRSDAQLYYNRGCAHLAAGRLGAALADFNKSIELDELHLLANMAYNNRGITQAKRGDYESALADFNEAVRINAADPLAYRNRALAHKLLGNHAAADADLVKAAEMAP